MAHHAFDERLSAFAASYPSALQRIVALARRAAVCTIYNGALDIERATAARLGVALFDDVILRLALEFSVDVLELRAVCTEPSDYAKPIEPSGQGGSQIAAAVARLAGHPAGSRSSSCVWAAARA